MEELKMSLFNENGEFTNNQMLVGMFLGRLGLNFKQVDAIFNGDNKISDFVAGKEILKEVPVEVIKEVEVVKEVEVEKPVEIEVEKIVEKEVVKPVTIGDIIEYITRDNVDVVPIVDALRQCNYLSINDDSKTLNDFEMSEIVLHILQNGSKTILYQLYDKIGDILKHSGVRILARTDYLSESKINEIIDSNINPEKAREYLIRFIKNDKSVPMLTLAKMLSYLPTANIRKSRMMADIDHYYDMVENVLQKIKYGSNSSLMMMMNFVFAAKSQSVNDLNQNHTFKRIGKYHSPSEVFSKILKNKIESSSVVIGCSYKINRNYPSKNGTLLDALSKIIGKNVLLNIIGDLGFTNVTTELLSNRFFILNWSTYKIRKSILSTNNVLFTDCSDLFVNGYSIYDYYLRFIEEIFKTIPDDKITKVTQCLVNYKIVPQIIRQGNNTVMNICKDAFLKNSESHGGTRGTMIKYMTDNNWKESDGVTNPMAALNKFIPAIELGNIFTSSVSEIASACKNIDHDLNKTQDWKHGTFTQIAKICVKYHVNLIPILRLYKDLPTHQFNTMRSSFYSTIRKAEI